MKKIINSKSAGEFRIGDLYKDIKDQLIGYTKKSTLSGVMDIYSKDELIALGFRGTPRRLFHINVLENDTEHKFLGKIGIGSTMQELEDIAGPYYDEYDTYELKDYPGIAFDVGDREEWPDDYWNEKEAPIICISVFDPELLDDEASK